LYERKSKTGPPATSDASGKRQMKKAATQARKRTLGIYRADDVAAGAADRAAAIGAHDDQDLQK
jgi:hypothetical protein